MEVVDEVLGAVSKSRGVRGRTRGELKSPATMVMGAGFGAKGCNLIWLPSRSVFLLLTIISSFRRLILNLRLLSTFSWCTGGTFGLGGRSADDFSVSEIRGLLHGDKLAGLQVPSRFARIITEAREGSGLGGGVPSSSNFANSHCSRQRLLRGNSSSSESDGCGVGGNSRRLFPSSGRFRFSSLNPLLKMTFSPNIAATLNVECNGST